MTEASAVAIAAIERTLEVKAAPERVWRAISDPDELARWFPQRADWELRPGGRGTFFWEGHGDFEIRVEAVEPGRYLAWRWGDETVASLDDPARTTLVEWWIEARPDGGTRLRLRESGFSTPERRAGNDEGWTEELGELAALLDAETA
ncbi:MAG TPA: SRPBCC domain-containing protein [Candidatus Limnocylindria bacterium]|nr:SRPBCC domain-containing protein [Candidatus Limnocylindria bacterium]